MHMQNYQQVVGMMAGGSGSRLITVEEGAVLIEELETTAPPVNQTYSPEIALALRAALTDAELFVSYNMPDKALGPLMAALPIAPMDVRLNQRLAALHTRSERFADAAACCRNLEQVYDEAGLCGRIPRYGELAQRYEERSSPSPRGACGRRWGFPRNWPIDPVPEAPAVAGWRPTTLRLQAHAENSAQFTCRDFASPSTSEIDLSSEWDDELAVEADATPSLSG